MYNTVKEAHIALEMGLQHISSNRKQSILPDHKDMALNYAVLQFIETRTNPKTNIKQEGLESTQKRYDDIKDLKVKRELEVFVDKGNLNRVFSILPYDYYKGLDAGGDVTFSKFNLPSADDQYTIYSSFLKFEDSTSSNLEKYNNFVIKKAGKSIFESSSYVGLPDFYSDDAKFMIINLVLEELNKRDDIDVYWERWNNIYRKDCFIIVDVNNSNYTLSYDNKEIKADVKEITYNKYSKHKNNIKALNLISSTDEFGIINNYYHNKNVHNNPYSFIEGDRLYAYNGDRHVITNMVLNYYKKPRLISLRHNQSCEISVNREIVDLAIQRLKAYVKDEGYQHIVNESQIVE